MGWPTQVSFKHVLLSFRRSCCNEQTPAGWAIISVKFCVHHRCLSFKGRGGELKPSFKVIVLIRKTGFRCITDYWSKNGSLRLLIPGIHRATWRLFGFTTTRSTMHSFNAFRSQQQDQQRILSKRLDHCRQDRVSRSFNTIRSLWEKKKKHIYIINQGRVGLFQASLPHQNPLVVCILPGPKLPQRKCAVLAIIYLGWKRHEFSSRLSLILLSVSFFSFPVFGFKGLKN